MSESIKYCESLTQYHRLKTRVVHIGDIVVTASHDLCADHLYPDRTGQGRRLQGDVDPHSIDSRRGAGIDVQQCLRLCSRLHDPSYFRCNRSAVIRGCIR